MKKRIVAVVLSVMMCSSMLVGCGDKAENKDTGSASTGGSTTTESSTTTEGTTETKDTGEAKDPLGKFAEPVTVTSVLNYSAAGPDSPKDVTPENNSFNKAALERLNIQVEWLWTAPADQYDQKLGVALASGDLPDVLTVKGVDYQNLLENEQIKPWNEALEYASPEFKEWLYRDPSVLESVTNENGEIMAIPQYWDPKRQVNMLMIRQDWLDKVGMEIPTTIDELEAVSKAFMEQMGATTGISATKTIIPRYVASISSLMNMFGSYPGDWTEAADGTLQPGEISPNTKNALETLNRFYKEGIINKEFALYDFTKMREDLLNNQLGIYIGPFWGFDTAGRVIAKNQDSRWVTAPLPTAEGTKGAIMDVRSVEEYWVLNKECESPEAVIKLFNLWVDFETTYPEEAQVVNGHVWNWAPVSYFDPYDINELHDSFNKQIATGDFSKMPDTTGPNQSLWQYAESYYKWKSGEGEYDIDNKWGKYLARIDEEGAWGTAKRIEAEGKYELGHYYGIATETMSSRRATLDKLSEETYMKIIMGEMSIDKFDEYTKNWLALGGQDTIDEVNEWYKINK